MIHRLLILLFIPVLAQAQSEAELFQQVFGKKQKRKTSELWNWLPYMATVFGEIPFKISNNKIVSVEEGFGNSKKFLARFN